MPIGDRDYSRGSHPPYCTCADCVNRRLSKWKGSGKREPSGWKPVPPRRVNYGSKSNGLLAWVFKLAIIFILLIFGIAGWSLWGNQIIAYFNNLSPGFSPTVTEPLPQSPTTNVPSPTSTPETAKPPTVPASPSTPVQSLVYKHEELVAYALELINQDREAHGLSPVILGSNTAAQKHAEERLANRYGSHWGMDGLKPYMRYTLAGGENYDAENGFFTETIWSGSKDPSYKRDAKEMLEQAQEGLMDSPGHRRNILDKWHKKVNLGIAYDDERLDLAQQFEGDYIDFSKSPNITDSILTMAGEVSLGTIENVSLYYDPIPQPLTPAQLDAPPYDYAYDSGEDIGTILSPPPPGSFYIDLLPNDVIATTWDVNSDGAFTIKASIDKILQKGEGVYTVVVWVETGGEYVAISNYSVFVR
jgi:uncharacterized protein YkwD